MAVQEIVLHPSSSLQVAFQGRIVAQAKSPVDNPKLQGRSHTITVYESMNGDLIAAIDFRTDEAHELDFCLVEPSVGLEEISDLLACQDPTEHIDRNRFREQNSLESESFLKAIYHDYDLLSLQIEKQLQTFVPTEREAPNVSERDAKRSGWRIWNLFSSEKQNT